MMSFSRKLELIGGIIVILIGIALVLAMIRLDYAVALELGREFSLAPRLKVGFFLHILPSLIVAIGAYAHALKEQPWGLIPLYLGSLFLVLTLSRQLLIYIAFQVTDIFVLLLLLHLLAVIATMVAPPLALILDKDD